MLYSTTEPQETSWNIGSAQNNWFIYIFLWMLGGKVLCETENLEPMPHSIFLLEPREYDRHLSLGFSVCLFCGFEHYPRPTFSITLKISLGRSSRFFLILTNDIKEGGRFMIASHKILSSHWSALVWTPYEESKAVSVQAQRAWSQCEQDIFSRFISHCLYWLMKVGCFVEWETFLFLYRLTLLIYWLSRKSR